MTMLRNSGVIAALATVFLLSTPVAQAQTVENATSGTPYVFEVIDAYELRGDLSGTSNQYVLVTGILKEESTVRTFRFTMYNSTTDRLLQNQRCDRMALLAMTKPGRYYFQLTTTGTGLFGFNCKLERR
jgi:hypothetical protein